MVAPDWQEICEVFKSIYMEHTQERFPQDPLEQLLSAVQAVFRSWNNPRAITYRKIHKIAHDLGTAVTIQEMVLAIVVLQVELALLLLAIRRQDTEDYLVNFSLVHKEKMLSRGSYAKTD